MGQLNLSVETINPSCGGGGGWGGEGFRSHRCSSLLYTWG